MCLTKLGTKSTKVRGFNRTFVAFLNTTEASNLNQWINELLDENEDYIANFVDEPESDSEPEQEPASDPVTEREMDEYFGSDSSDDEDPMSRPYATTMIMSIE